MATIPIFSGFYDGLYQFLQSVSVSDEYLLKYYFSMIFMMVYINSCSLLVGQMNIYRDSTHTDVNWLQFNVKMIENTKNRQFLLSKWPQYHSSMGFMMVYINICSMLVTQMNIYLDSTHTGVNWHQLDVKNDWKCAKLTIFYNFRCKIDFNWHQYVCYLSKHSSDSLTDCKYWCKSS